MKDQTWAVNNRKMCCSQEAEEHCGEGGPSRQQKRKQVLRERRPPWQAGLWHHFPLTIGLRVTLAWTSTEPSPGSCVAEMTQMMADDRLRWYVD